MSTTIKHTKKELTPTMEDYSTRRSSNSEPGKELGVLSNIKQSEKEDETKLTHKKKRHVRRRWSLLMAAFLCRMLSGGYAVSMGVFFVEFIKEFESGRGEAGWVISLSGGLMYGAGVPVSYILKKAGESLCCMVGAFTICTGLCVSYFATSIAFLIVSFGIATGIGMSFVLSSCAAAVNQNFSQGRGAAIAILESGLTIGGLAFPPLLRVLIDTYGWRGAILISAAILLNILPVGAFLSHSWTPTNPGSEKRLEQNGLLKSNRLFTTKSFCCSMVVWRKKLFVLYIICSVIIATGNAYVYAVIVDMGNIMGYGVNKSTYLVFSLSVSNIVGVVIMELLLKLFWNGATWLFVVNILIMATSMFIFPITKSYLTLMLAASLYGITAGGLYGTYLTVVTNLLDKEHYTVGTGLTCSGYGLGTALSAPIAGWIRDLTGDYKNSFFVGGGLCFASVSVLFGVLLVDFFQRKHKPGVSKDISVFI